MRHLAIILLLAVVISAKSYHDHQVLRIRGVTPEVLDYLEDGFDVWAILDQDTVDVMVPSAKVEDMQQLGLDFEIFIPDVQEVIDEARKAGNGDSFYEDYHRIEEIYERLEFLQSSYPDLVKEIFTVGQTYEVSQQ